MQEHILMYESNYVNSYSYRVITWENSTQRYALLDEHLTGDYKYGLVEFTYGTTLASCNAKLNKNMLLILHRRNPDISDGVGAGLSPESAAAGVVGAARFLGRFPETV